MLDDMHMLDLIEHALDREPYCSFCNATTDIRERRGRLWLECSSVPMERPTRLLVRLRAALLPHPRRLLIDLRDGRAAQA